MATAQPIAIRPKILSSRPAPETLHLYREGIVAGIVAAATIALWFLIVDALNGQPLYTPSVLGTALFHSDAGSAALENLSVSFRMVLLFTGVHGFVFICIGGIASRFLGSAEQNPDLGFGILLLFVIFEVGFVTVNVLFAEHVLHALAWPTVLVGNVLAAAAMAGYFWRRHPHLVVRP